MRSPDFGEAMPLATEPQCGDWPESPPCYRRVWGALFHHPPVRERILLLAEGAWSLIRSQSVRNETSRYATCSSNWAFLTICVYFILEATN